MCVAQAIADAKLFLWKHPLSTTEIDNPVEILEDIVREYDKDEDDEDDEDEGMVPDEDENGDASKSERLLTFIKNLRDQRKICEAEYQAACAIQ
jgi:hypothetical protein